MEVHKIVIVKRAAHKVSYFLDYLARWVLTALMLLVVGNVIMRCLLKSPIQGTVEFVEFLNAVVIGLALAYCATLGGHIFVTFFTERLNKTLQLVIDIVIDLLVLAFLGLTVSRLYIYGQSMYQLGQVSLTTQTPYYPFVYTIVVGVLAYCLVVVGDIIENIAKAVKK